jgi:hypothetical protein
MDWHGGVRRGEKEREAKKEEEEEHKLIHCLNPNPQLKP